MERKPSRRLCATMSLLSKALFVYTLGIQKKMMDSKIP